MTTRTELWKAKLVAAKAILPAQKRILNAAIRAVARTEADIANLEKKLGT